ncbi:Tetraketide alpha-pyrone reductase 2 [Platanthera guangdongensis]|uniref:Tetraketide alpha-pyrone reductase 2 n=1 Tax=Platanthera guangdongensis TaxID=2320717 RepID=A0ABR2MHJ1_9ASPA
MNVLKSCLQASSIKRVVLTSSCSAIRYRHDSTSLSPLNESHWSDTEYCKRFNLWYAYGKTMAEKEAWKFVEENGLDLVVVNPSFVVGPVLTQKPTSTLLKILLLMKGDSASYPNTTIGFVHINDVVSTHMLAMEDSRASGRLICSCSVAHWSEVVEMLRTKYPAYPISNNCDDKQGDNNPHSMDTNKVKELGLKSFKTITQMFDDCIQSFQQKGLL